MQYEAEEKVAKTTKESALSGLQTVSEDFKALTGVYPEDAQTNKIKAISIIAATE
jgi:hypothetical protein